MKYTIIVGNLIERKCWKKYLFIYIQNYRILQWNVVQSVRFLRVELAYPVSSPQLNIGFCIFLDLFHGFESSTQHWHIFLDLFHGFFDSR
jgi:hypothetical protein